MSDEFLFRRITLYVIKRNLIYWLTCCTTISRPTSWLLKSLYITWKHDDVSPGKTHYDDNIIMDDNVPLNLRICHTRWLSVTYDTLICYSPILNSSTHRLYSSTFLPHHHSTIGVGTTVYNRREQQKRWTIYYNKTRSKKKLPSSIIKLSIFVTPKLILSKTWEAIPGENNGEEEVGKNVLKASCM